jgi:tetratricopeptide (TPR) repeat protein
MGTEKFYNLEFQQALIYYDKAIELDPDFTMARYFKWIANWNMDNRELARELVEEMYARVEDDDYLDQLYIRYAQSLFDKDLSETERYLKLILDEIPYSRGWNYETARFYIQAGRHKDALPYLEKALEIDKSWGTNWTFIGFYESLGRAYRAIGQLQMEEEAYKKGLNIHPDHPFFLSLLAENAFLQGQDDKAEDYITRYKSVREARNDQANIIGIGIGRIYMNANRNDDAERIYRDIIASGQESQWVKSELAYLLFMQEKNLVEGMELINEVLKIGPESDYLLRIKGLGLYKMKEYNAAYNVLIKAIELEYFYVNETFLLLQNVEEALRQQGDN